MTSDSYIVKLLVTIVDDFLLAENVVFFCSCASFNEMSFQLKVTSKNDCVYL